MTGLIVTVKPGPAGGHSLDSAYVEWFWLPTLGPTALLAARRLHALATAVQPVDTQTLAAMLGIASVNGALAHTLGRLDRFRVAAWDQQAGTVEVVDRLPRLSALLRAAHDAHERQHHQHHQQEQQAVVA